MAFKPYTIKHLSLGAIADYGFTADNAFLVFWWNHIPVCHVWIEPYNAHLSPEQHRKQVVDAAWPALTYYLNEHPKTAKLYEVLLNGNTQSITALLNELSEALLLPQSNHSAVSVVVCTRNRTKQLKQCIDAILKSIDDNFQLIVVDNAPDNNETQQLVAAYNSPIIKYVLEPRKGLDNARNAGLLNADYDIIAYTDDDVEVSKDWITNIKAGFANPLTMAVTGLVLPASLSTKPQYMFEKHFGFNRGYAPKVFDHHYFLDNLPYGVPVWDIGAGANMAFRKQAFQLVGLFDERLDVGASGCSGDSEIWYRILAEGWNCLYHPLAVVYHQHRADQQSLTHQVFHYMRGHVSALLVQHEKYGHEGNLFRLRKGLKTYYLNRISDFLSRKGNAHLSTWLTEVRGCFSGYRFYQQHRHTPAVTVNLPFYAEQLNPPAQVTADVLISVVITCYNIAKYLSACLQSVKNQTYPHVEIILVDDGSTDDTAAVAAKFPGIQYVYVHRVGLSAARNIGVQHSHGSYVLFLDADDVLMPAALELNLSYFKHYPQAAFVNGNFNDINAAGEVTGTHEAVNKTGYNYAALLQGNYIGMEGTVLYKRSLFFYFHFNTRLQACEDYALNMAIARYFETVTHHHVVASYRKHGNNMSANQERMMQYVLQVMDMQQPFLKADEKQSWQQGIANWTAYYSNQS